MQDRLEVELHRQLRKARKAVVVQTKRTRSQLQEIRALPEPDSDVIEAEGVPVMEEENPKEEETERGE